MGQRHKSSAARESTDDQHMRDQEVLRASRELSAYFKGGRTEREARAALKIIKAFVREREGLDPTSRPPLPGASTTKLTRKPAKRDVTSDGGKRHRVKRRRKPHETSSKRGVGAIDPPVTAQAPPSGRTAPDTE